MTEHIYAEKKPVTTVAFIAALTVAALLNMSTASAKPFTMKSVFIENYERWIDKSQSAKLHLEVQVDGSGYLLGTFANGKRWDGDDYFGKAVFYDANNIAIFKATVTRRVKPSRGGATVVKQQQSDFKLPKDVLRKTTEVRMQVGHYGAHNLATMTTGRIPTPNGY